MNLSEYWLSLHTLLRHHVSCPRERTAPCLLPAGAAECREERTSARAHACGGGVGGTVQGRRYTLKLACKHIHECYTAFSQPPTMKISVRSALSIGLAQHYQFVSLHSFSFALILSCVGKERKRDIACFVAGSRFSHQP